MELDHLNKAEMIELTGYRQAKRQVTWLRDRRWLHVEGGDGHPRVSRAYYNQRMNAATVLAKKVDEQPAINLTALAKSLRR